MEPNIPVTQNPVEPPQPAQQPIESNPLPVKKSLPKWPLIIVGIILLATLITGTYLLGRNQNVNQNPTSKTVQTPTPTPDETANWKTYTNPKMGYSFKYPSDWQEELASSDGPVYKYYNLTLKKDGYQINIYANLYGVGGAINRYVAKAEIANINNLASTTKAYINMDQACSFDSEASPSIPPQTCTETFNEISILNSSDIKNTDVENVNVITTTREYPCFVDSTHRFEISLTTPRPINISDINSNAYVSTYNQILSTFKFTDQTVTNSETANWQTYTSTMEPSLSFKYPSTWTLTQNSNVTSESVTLSSANGTKLIYATGGNYNGGACSDQATVTINRVRPLPLASGYSLVDVTLPANKNGGVKESLNIVEGTPTVGTVNGCNYNSIFSSKSNPNQQIIFGTDTLIQTDKQEVSQILSTLKFTDLNTQQAGNYASEGQSCGENAGAGGNAQCAPGLSCANIDLTTKIGTCIKQ